jgi:hypothetical protein
MAPTFRRGLLPKVHKFLGLRAQSRLSRPAKLAGHRAAPSVTPESCPKSGFTAFAGQLLAAAWSNPLTHMQPDGTPARESNSAPTSADAVGTYSCRIEGVAGPCDYGRSVEVELVALDVLHHHARLVVVIGKQ